MIKYTAEKVNEEFIEIGILLEERHSESGRTVSETVERECFWFAAVVDVYARITHDMEFTTFEIEPTHPNILELLAEWVNESDTYELSTEMYEECLRDNTHIIRRRPQ